MEPSTYQLKVTLDDVKPPICRRILVPADYSLERLHRVIQIAMGWNNSHLHLFERDGIQWGDAFLNEDYVPGWSKRVLSERRTFLSQLLSEPGDQLRYVYDFGDGWTHTVVLEKVLPATAIEGKPVCTGGKRACPPDDCGGPDGYAELLEALADPKHPDHENFMEWVDGYFEPEDFDELIVNLKFSSSFRKRRTRT